MKQQRFNEQFASIYDLAVSLSKQVDADVLLVMLDGPTDWAELSKRAGREKILAAADTEEALEGAKEAGLDTIVLGMHDAPVFEKLTQALLESVADEILEPNSEVVAVYSGFEADSMDSISFIRLDEHLGRLTARDLRQIETSVPLETLKVVVDLAVDIGREGREGKPVGTMFVVGDTRNVISLSHPAGYDPVKGYGRKERSLPDRRVREAIKEVAPLDGAFIVAPDGTVEKACQIVDADHVNLTLSKGLGARHWAAAAISKSTNAIAVVVSESNGTVRLFKDGEVILRIEPFRRAMKWKDFEYEPPSPSGD
ncbi:MAG: DNA integrity scanning protein DisA nucleotide-binding domain protein [Planctomycetes bacterium]|nr:DNA integrity scanning protein DisA nucleotide-binding domain protein [Planctomycetota bacterium]